MPKTSHCFIFSTRVIKDDTCIKSLTEKKSHSLQTQQTTTTNNKNLIIHLLIAVRVTQLTRFKTQRVKPRSGVRMYCLFPKYERGSNILVVLQRLERKIHYLISEKETPSQLDLTLFSQCKEGIYCFQ